VPRSVIGIALMISARVCSSERVSMVAIARISVSSTIALDLSRRIGSSCR